MSAREAILGRIRAAVGGDPGRGDERYLRIERDYRRRWDAPRDEIIARFAQRLHDYGVTVTQVEEGAELAMALAQRVRERDIPRLAVPAGLPEAWRPAGVELVDAEALDHRRLNAIEGVMTGCALAVAETGSIVLDGGANQGRRRLTLLPDYHLCVVFTDQIVGLMPEAIAQLHAAGRAGAPITFISGPSATADIELNRVQGVHGPRTLDVVLVGAATQASRFNSAG